MLFPVNSQSYWNGRDGKSAACGLADAVEFLRFLEELHVEVERGGFEGEGHVGSGVNAEGELHIGQCGQNHQPRCPSGNIDAVG
jgi:hypothetical protein